MKIHSALLGISSGLLLTAAVGSWSYQRGVADVSVSKASLVQPISLQTVAWKGGDRCEDRIGDAIHCDTQNLAHWLWIQRGGGRSSSREERSDWDRAENILRGNY